MVSPLRPRSRSPRDLSRLHRIQSEMFHRSYDAGRRRYVAGRSGKPQHAKRVTRLLRTNQNVGFLPKRMYKTAVVDSHGVSCNTVCHRLTIGHPALATEGLLALLSGPSGFFLREPSRVICGVCRPKSPKLTGCYHQNSQSRHGHRHRLCRAILHQDRFPSRHCQNRLRRVRVRCRLRTRRPCKRIGTEGKESVSRQPFLTHFVQLPI